MRWVKNALKFLNFLHNPYKFANRIVNEVNGMSLCMFDITSKPPGMIEWE